MAKGKRELILEEADKLAARGKLDAAIKEYRKALDLAPHDTTTLNRLGDLLVKVNRIDEAVDVYQKIAEHFADDGFFLKAIAIFKKINRFDPQRTEIYERLADLYYKQGLAVEGRQQLLTLAEWHLRSREHEEAIRVYRKLAELEPTNFQMRAKLVDVLIQKGDVDAVTDEIDDLGQALLERTMMDEAIKLYHRAIELHPLRGNFVARCLDALLDGARLPQAVDLADRALAGTGGGVELKRAAGQVFAAANQLDRARGLLEEIFPQAAERFEVVQAYADVLLRSGDIERAEEVVLPAIDRLIGARDARRAATLLKRLLRKASDSIPVLERATRVFDRSSEPEVFQSVETALADAYRKAGRVADALPIYRRLVDENPANQLAAERLAELEGTGSIPAADAPPTEAPPVTAADTASEISEDSSDFVEIDLDSDEPPPTFEEPEVAAAGVKDERVGEGEIEPAPAAPPDTTVEELFTEATVFAKYGLADKAITHLQRLLALEPSHAAAHELLASLAGAAPEPPVPAAAASDIEEAAEAGAEAEEEVVEQASEEILAASPDVEAEAELVGPAFPPEDLEFAPPEVMETASAAPGSESPLEMEGPLPVEIPEELFEPIAEEAAAQVFAVEDGESADATAAPVEEQIPSFAPEEFTAPGEATSEIPGPSFETAEALGEAAPPPPEPVDLPAAPPPPSDEPIALTPEPAQTAPEPVEPVAAAHSEPPRDVVEARPVKVPAAAPTAPSGRAAHGSLSLDDLEAALGIKRTVPSKPRPKPVGPGVSFDLDAVLGTLSTGDAGRRQAAKPLSHETPAVSRPAPVERHAESAEDEALEAAFAASGEEEISVEAVEIAAAEEEFVDVADVLAGPDEERLREVDFLIEQGLLDDAGKVLGSLREESGDHPEIGSRQAALKARGWDESAPSVASDTAESLFSEEEQFFDLAAELERELADEELVAEATGAGQGAEVSIEELFKEFQRGVAQQVSEEDFDTHFNLGLAYREMGLFDEAIGEFQLAGKSSTYMIECATMIGACYMDKGLPEQAAEWYDRALRAPDLPAETELGLRYELGRTQEAAGNTGVALSYYAEVLAINPGFRDVVDRVSRLQSN